jgi:hypothetical protein
VTVLAAWGAEEVMTGASWTLGAGATRALSATVPNPFGLIQNVYTVNNPAGSQSFIDRAVTVPAAARHVVPIFLRSNGTVNAGIQFSQGSTSGTLQINLNGSGDVTTIVQESATAGASTRGAAIKLGVGVAGGAAWYLILAEFAGITAGAGTLRLYPNLTGFASAGQTVFYIRPAWTHSRPLYDAFDAPQPRGAFQRFSAAGVRDTWRGGNDETLRGTLRFIPRAADLDLGSSGWDGAGSDLVGIGFRSLYEAALNAQTIRWVRDRADCTDWNDGQLVEPFDRVDGDVNDDGTKNVPIRLQSTTGQYRGAL